MINADIKTYDQLLEKITHMVVHGHRELQFVGIRLGGKSLAHPMLLLD